MKDIETETREFIVPCFRRLRSSSKDAFDLVQNFKVLNSRPAIHSLIEERYNDILVQYDKELAALRLLFETHRDNPFEQCSSCFPPKSGAVSWAVDLYDRAKRPIIQFRQKEGYLDRGFGATVKRRYLEFAQSIDKYKLDIFQDWIDNDCSKAISLLMDNIIRTLNLEEMSGQICDRSSGSFMDSNGRKSAKQYDIQYETNFPEEVLLCCDEAKEFYHLEFSIPNNIVEIALQQESYCRYVRGK